MTQRPAGQLNSDLDVFEQLEALLRDGADGPSSRHSNPVDEDEDRIRRLQELTAGYIDPEPQTIYRSDDDPRDHELIDQLRARTRSERRADRVRRSGRRAAVLTLVGGLVITILMPALATVGTPDAEPPAAVSSPAPSTPSPTPSSTPTPTVTAAPGALVRGTTEDGSPVVVVIPAEAPSGFFDLLLQVVSGAVITVVTVVTTVLLTPLTRRLQRRPGQEVFRD
ncbi:MAG: hypothetical protein PGN11_03135 [Quadrisphaera sp.]